LHEDKSGVDTNISTYSRNYMGKGKCFHGCLAVDKDIDYGREETGKHEEKKNKRRF